MFDDLKHLLTTQRAKAFMFAGSLVALAASALGVVWQLVRGNLVVALAAVVLVRVIFALVPGSVILAVARQLRGSSAK